MNLITRTIPALLLGLSGLTLSGASQADSRFSVTISSGYAPPPINYAYHDSYRPRASYYNPYRHTPIHVDRYVEKYIYRDYRHNKRHYRDDDYDDHHGYRKHHKRDKHHSRKHGDRNERRRHTGYTVSARY